MYSDRDFAVMTEVFKTHVPGLKTLLLFGSYANGTAGEESDADIAVIVEKPLKRAEKLATLNKIWQILGRLGYQTDIVIKDVRRFKQDKEISVTIAHAIEQGGIVLWKKD